MKKILFLILSLLITVNLYATPDSNMTIATVSDADTIEASEHNTARNAISSTYNAHSHTDITSLTSLGAVGTISTGVWNGTAVTVTYGGTGVATLTDGGILIGNGTGAIVATAVLADGEILVGDGTTDPVAESGATLRASIGVAIGTDVQAYDAQLADLADGTLSGASTVNVATAATGVLPLANGGTASTTGLHQLFTSSGTFTAPTGVTKVFLTMVGGGGAGGTGSSGSAGGGGGGGGESVINYPYTVVAGNNYTVTINGAGGTTVFDALTMATGTAGSGVTAGVGGGTTNLLNGVDGAGSGSVGGGQIKGGNGGLGLTGGAVAGGGGGGTPFGIGGAGHNDGTGYAGTGYGAGGGGGGGSGGSFTGGAGTGGFVKVEW